jgi:threonine/homoserine/homoserine lactone efflux protein
MILDLLWIMVAGVGLGLSLAVPPGPVNAIIAVQSSTRSSKSGFLVGLGAMTADAVFLIITYLAGDLITFSNVLKAAFYTVSFLLMLFLAVMTLKSLGKVGKLADNGGGKRNRHLPYVTGLTIGLTNPLQITWWLTVGLSLIAGIGLLIIVGFFSGILLWITLFPLAMHWGSKKFPSLYRWVLYASTALLAAFALWFLYSLSVVLFGI